MGEMEASRDISVAASLQSTITEDKKGSKQFVMMD